RFVRHTSMLALLIAAGFGIARGAATENYRFDGQAGAAENLGAAVACWDVDHDGRADIVAGGPEWPDLLDPGLHRGVVRIFSGRTGTQLSGSTVTGQG